MSERATGESPIEKAVRSVGIGPVKATVRSPDSPDPIWEVDAGWPHGHAEASSLPPEPQLAVNTDWRGLKECGSLLVVAAAMWAGPPDAKFWHDTDTLRVGATTADGRRWEYVDGAWTASVE